jgi:hypothetical protein
MIEKIVQTAKQAVNAPVLAQSALAASLPGCSWTSGFGLSKASSLHHATVVGDQLRSRNETIYLGRRAGWLRLRDPSTPPDIALSRGLDCQSSNASPWLPSTAAKAVTKLRINKVQ